VALIQDVVPRSSTEPKRLRAKRAAARRINTHQGVTHNPKPFTISTNQSPEAVLAKDSVSPTTQIVKKFDKLRPHPILEKLYQNTHQNKIATANVKSPMKRSSPADYSSDEKEQVSNVDISMHSPTPLKIVGDHQRSLRTGPKRIRRIRLLGLIVCSSLVIWLIIWPR